MATSILRDTPITFREAAVPYAMAGLNMLAPTLAARDNIMPQVLIAAIAMIVLGIPCSIYFRQRQYNRLLLNFLVTVPLLVFTWALVRNHAGLQIDWSNPLVSIASQDGWTQIEALLNIFILISAGRAFLLITSKELVQTPIPGISIFLLAVITMPWTGTATHDVPRFALMVVCLFVLLASSLYLFSHDHIQQWFSIRVPGRIQRQLVLWMVIFAIGLFPIVVMLGYLMRPFNMYSLANVSRGRAMSRLFRLTSFLGGQVGVSYGMPIDMGGANWPSGKQHMLTVRVKDNTPQNLLWRAGSYSQYEDGKWEIDPPLPPFIPGRRANDDNWEREGWRVEKATATVVHVLVNPKGPASDPGIVQGVKEGLISEKNLLTQHVTVHAQTAGNYAPIHGAFQVAGVKSSDPRFNQAIVSTDGSIALADVHSRSPLQPYEVVSVIKPLPAAMQLRGNPQLSGEERARFLQMPGGNSFISGERDGPYAEKLREEAVRILQGRFEEFREYDLFSRREGITDLDMVRQIEFHLGKNYRYTLKPSPPENNEDAIIDFLFRQKQGYCNYFSGAMVMLCRSAGIPARFVVGFATGEQQEQEAGSDEVVYKVNSEHAHSWVEVYLDHYGWYTMDPTAGSTEVPTLWGQTWDLLSEMGTIIKNNINDLTKQIRENQRARAYFNLGLAALLVITALVIYLRREHPPAYPKKELTPDEARATVIHAYERMHRWLRMWGVTKPDGITAGEFDQLFRSLNEPMGRIVSELSDLYIRTLYAPEPVVDSDARRAIDLLQELWVIARSERKRLMLPETEA